MKTLIFVSLTISAFATSAFAAKVTLRFENTLVGVHQTGSGMERVYVETLADGKVRISMGRVVPQVVEATIVNDLRPTDGPLVLKLGAVGTLAVGSGFNPTGTQSFTLTKGSDTIELHPLVFMDVK